MKTYVVPIGELSMRDLSRVGSKNAALGDIMQHYDTLGIRVPGGFAITVDAYFEFLAFNCLSPQIQYALNRLNRRFFENLAAVGAECRQMILEANFPESVKAAIREAYQNLKAAEPARSVAVRSSATAEDSPSASFAGQHDTYLNVDGFEAVLQAVKQCYASVFNNRAIKYRNENGFSDLRVGLSVGVQHMVRSDKASAGVIFTIEPETGNQQLIYLTGAWGLGEGVVQGAINTDDFYLFKPALARGTNPIVYRQRGEKEQMLVYHPSLQKQWQPTPAALRRQYILAEQEVVLLGQWAHRLEDYYQTPMDIEWAKDGISGALYIVQARSETVHTPKQQTVIREFKLLEKATPLLSGKAIGHAIVSGRVCNLKSLADGTKVKAGDILVADSTNPDWYVLFSRAAAIITNRGGKTSHAAILARELGIPAIVGIGNATEVLADGQHITVSCACGDEGKVYAGSVAWEEKIFSRASIPATRTRPLITLTDPHKCFCYASYPAQGIGLLQLGQLVQHYLQHHAEAWRHEQEGALRTEKGINHGLSSRYVKIKQTYINGLAESLGLIAAAFYPREVVVRLDFQDDPDTRRLKQEVFAIPLTQNQSHQHQQLVSSQLGHYAEELVCAVIKKVREDMLLNNVEVLLPLCESPEAYQEKLGLLQQFGLQSSKGPWAYVMAEVIANRELVVTYAQWFKGLVITHTSLSHLMRRAEQKQGVLSSSSEGELEESLQKQLQVFIALAHAHGLEVSYHHTPERPGQEHIITFLAACGIDSISFEPDALIGGIQTIAVAEAKRNAIS